MFGCRRAAFLPYHFMKRKSASLSAFFNIRVLIGVFILVAGVLLALASSGVFSVAAQNVIHAMTLSRVITYSTDPLASLSASDCSTIHEKGIDKQENFRAGAIMIALRPGRGRVDLCARCQLGSHRLRSSRNC